jgi:hypothetical protein
MKNLIFLYVLGLTFLTGFSQTPSGDPNFIQIFNDDFINLDRTKWFVYNRESWAPQFIDDPTTISVSGDKLNLTANYTPSGPYPYAAASIRSLQNFYPGTYFECKSAIPIGINAYPAFWVWEGYGDCRDNNYREIDILEWTNFSGHSTSNLHFCRTSCYFDTCRTGNRGEYNIANPNDFHIFSCFWNKRNIIIQTDQRTVQEWPTPSKLSTNSMKIENSLAVYDSYLDHGTTISILDVSSFPFTYQTEYIKAYRLLKSNPNCDLLDPVIEINFSTYSYSLKKSISLSGATTVPSGGSISLRAVDYIELYDGFEVPNNTNFYMNTNECY